mmetsp:Transcript_72357/g.188746  ORF Transcript_72357/g.188746 Transcript_72357/m.188746 type:complete len:347 (+) Transcript_72357:203-1243(+)
MFSWASMPFFQWPLLAPRARITFQWPGPPAEPGTSPYLLRPPWCPWHPPPSALPWQPRASPLPSTAAPLRRSQLASGTPPHLPHCCHRPGWAPPARRRNSAPRDASAPPSPGSSLPTGPCTGGKPNTRSGRTWCSTAAGRTCTTSCTPPGFLRTWSPPQPRSPRWAPAPRRAFPPMPRRAPAPLHCQNPELPEASAPRREIAPLARQTSDPPEAATPPRQRRPTPELRRRRCPVSPGAPGRTPAPERHRLGRPPPARRKDPASRPAPPPRGLGSSSRAGRCTGGSPRTRSKRTWSSTAAGRACTTSCTPSGLLRSWSPPQPPAPHRAAPRQALPPRPRQTPAPLPR